MHDADWYQAITAWATCATAACALIVVWAQVRSARQLACMQLFFQLAAQYDSADMRQTRSRLANVLLADAATVAIDDTLLVFFENLAMLHRRKFLDKDFVWNMFVFDITRYWELVKHFVLHARNVQRDASMYEEFEKLASKLIQTKRSPLGTLVPCTITDEDCRAFLEYEAARGAPGK